MTVRSPAFGFRNPWNYCYIVFLQFPKITKFAGFRSGTATGGGEGICRGVLPLCRAGTCCETPEECRSLPRSSRKVRFMRLAMRAWLISLPTYALHTRRTGCARCSSQPAQSVRGLAHSLASGSLHRWIRLAQSSLTPLRARAQCKSTPSWVYSEARQWCGFPKMKS